MAISQTKTQQKSKRRKSSENMEIVCLESGKTWPFREFDVDTNKNKNNDHSQRLEHQTNEKHPNALY